MKEIKRWTFFLLLCAIGVLYFWYGDGGGSEAMAEVYEEALADAGELNNMAELLPETQSAFSEQELTGGLVSEHLEGQESVSDGDAGTAEEEPAVPIIGSVEDDYFSDALFIGDSRTVGLFEYGGLETTAAFYCSTGLTVYKVFEEELAESPDQSRSLTVEEALQIEHFRKIYIMLGINEMGRGTVESFTETYREMLVHLQELQPDAVIYVQAIMKVTEERSGKGDYITNEGIEERNEALRTLADGERIFFLDVNPVICDETGGLTPDYTTDGVHLKAKYIGLWKEYLKENAVLLD